MLCLAVPSCTRGKKCIIKGVRRKVTGSSDETGIMNIMQIRGKSERGKIVTAAR